MAKLKIVDEAKAETLYQDLDEGLDSSCRKKIGNNTYLVRLSDTVIAIELHGHYVVVVWSDNVVHYDACGWHSATTASRMQSVAGKFGLRARRNHGWITVG